MWHDSVKGSGGIEKSLRQHANASIHSNDRSHGAKINKTGQASQYLGFGIGAWKKHTGKNLHLLSKKHLDEHHNYFDDHWVSGRISLFFIFKLLHMEHI